MSPLLLLKTRVMTMPEMRQSGGALATTIASSKLGFQVVRTEGLSALMKGSLTFSTKRVADWTTRFLFAEIISDSIKKYNAKQQNIADYQKVKLNFTEQSVSALLGGALSATATIPLDVLVATLQSADKAGQKVSILNIWREKIASGGFIELIRYSSKGYVARVAHVGATTFLMKHITSVIYQIMDSSKTK